MPKNSKNAIIVKGEPKGSDEPKPFLRLKQLETTPKRGVLDDALSNDSTVRADFRARVRHLQIVPRVQWTKKQFRSLGDKLFEIKWKSGNLEWRAMGYDDKDGYFVVVKVCTHKMNVYVPPNCINTSKSEKVAAESGTRRVISYDL